MNSHDSQDDPLRLTPDELAAEAHDRIIRGALREITESSEAHSEPLGVGIPAGELENWAALGNITKIKLALQAGQDINERGENGYTALHAAVVNGRSDIVQLLVLQGANVQAKLDSGESVMELAELAGNSEVLDFLRSLNEPNG